jgi:myo-inositol-1-phosphate synthase
MPLTKPVEIKPATGRLGILTPGMGAVATTFMAGVDAVRRGLAKPIGSLTQMGTIRLGKRTENRSPLIKDFIPLAKLDDIVFGGWDLFPDDAYQAASKAGVLTKEHLAQSKEFLSGIKPMTSVFEQSYVKR